MSASAVLSILHTQSQVVWHKLRRDGVKETAEAIIERVVRIYFLYNVVYRRWMRKNVSTLDRSELIAECTSIIVDSSPRWIPIKNDPSMFEKAETAMYNAAPRGVFEVENVAVDPLSGLARTRDGRIVTEVVTPPTSRDAGVGLAIAKTLEGGVNPARRRMLRTGIKSHMTDSATVLVPAFNNYYHWTVECLTRLCELSVYMDAHPAEDVQIIIPPDLPGWAHESLEMLDVADRCVQMDHPVSLDRLLVPSFGDPTRLECEWLRDQVTVQKEARRRVFISRTDATRRRVGNMDELKPIFDRWDIEIVVLSNLHVREQVKLFSQTELIIGVHGAGLTNLIYSYDADVIEIFGIRKKNTYARLCEFISLDYQYIETGQDGIYLNVEPDVLEHAIIDSI